MCFSGLIVLGLVLCMHVRALSFPYKHLRNRNMCLKITLDDALQQAVTLRPLSEGDLIQELKDSSKDEAPGSLKATLFTFAENSNFLKDFFQKKPLYVPHALPNVAGAFTMKDVEAALNTEFLEAGRGSFDNAVGGWTMAPVGAPRGSNPNPTPT